MIINIHREPVYYTADFQGLDVEQAPLYLQALTFDGEDNEYGAQLISQVNQRLVKEYAEHRLPTLAIKQLPHRILIINAASNQSPLAYETRRIWEAYIYKQGWNCFTRIVNSTETLLQEVRVEPEHTLVFSQCDNQGDYDVSFCQQLIELGAVVVPSLHTAPGGAADRVHISEVPEDRNLVAHYRLGTRGIVLESMYAQARLAPIRLLPLSPLMVEAIGGESNLPTILLKGAEALIELAEQLPIVEGRKPPLRLQVGLAPQVQEVSGVSGDTACGLCLATRWSDFVKYTLEWLEDGLGYYTHKRS